MTNEEKYKTPEDRLAAFREYCDRHRENFNGCTIGNCPLRTTSTRACQFFWLALEAEEEKPLPCPLCCHEASIITDNDKGSFTVGCGACGCRLTRFSREHAIEAWNRRAK